MRVINIHYCRTVLCQYWISMVLIYYSGDWSFILICRRQSKRWNSFIQRTMSPKELLSIDLYLKPSTRSMVFCDFTQDVISHWLAESLVTTWNHWNVFSTLSIIYVNRKGKQHLKFRCFRYSHFQGGQTNATALSRWSS